MYRVRSNTTKYLPNFMLFPCNFENFPMRRGNRMKFMTHVEIFWRFEIQFEKFNQATALKDFQKTFWALFFLKRGNPLKTLIGSDKTENWPQNFPRFHTTTRTGQQKYKNQKILTKKSVTTSTPKSQFQKWISPKNVFFNFRLIWLESLEIVLFDIEEFQISCFTWNLYIFDNIVLINCIYFKFVSLFYWHDRNANI